MASPLTRYNGNRVSCDTQIRDAGQRMATAREGMADRILKGFNSDYTKNGCWHPEGIARINGINYWCLGQFAPATLYARETLEANKAGQYLALTEVIKFGKKPASEVIKRIAELDADKPAEKRRVLIPARQDTFSVDSRDLGDVDIAQFLAGDARLAQDYGIFLDRDCRIEKVTFDQPFLSEDIATGLWLCKQQCDYFSDFDGSGRGNFDAEGGSSFGVSGRAINLGGLSVGLRTFAERTYPLVELHLQNAFLSELRKFGISRR